METFSEQIRQYLRQVGRWVRNVLIVAIAFAVLSAVKGVPHLQLGEYRYHKLHPRHTPSADEKLTAWYLSVTGWRQLDRDQYGPLTFVVFLPLRDTFSDQSPDSPTSLRGAKHHD